MIVGTETEEGYNKIVEVVKRLAENNLYIKLEKEDKGYIKLVNSRRS